MDATEFLGNSKWLKAKDFTLRERIRAVFRISDVTVESVTNFDGTEGRQLTLHFHGQEKMLGLNVTNNENVIGLYGPDTDAWIGKSVAVYVTQTRMKDGKQVDCLRIETRPPVKEISKSAVSELPPTNATSAIGNGQFKQVPVTPQLKQIVQQHPTHISSNMAPAESSDLPEDDIPF